jgi:hypothetical protein
MFTIYSRQELHMRLGVPRASFLTSGHHFPRSSKTERRRMHAVQVIGFLIIFVLAVYFLATAPLPI